jgi:predicted aldo/keto reductase-like oxidoreductase
MKDSNQYSRSDFFKGAGVIAGTAAMAGSSVRAAEKTQPSIGPAQRKLGKADLELPVVSLGTSPAQDPNVIKFAIAQGMNFIHTSLGYKNGDAVKNVAKAIKGQRDKVILGLKVSWKPDDDAAMDAALEMLGVDCVDIAFFNIHKAGQVHDEKYRQGAERWKKAGKCRYIGLTSHKDTSACLTAALDEGFYDVLMPSYALSMEQEFLPVFERAQKEGVGVILMKTNRGLSGAYEESVPHYLATPGVTTICKGAASFPEIKGLVQASKEVANAKAGIRLRNTAQIAMSGHCLMCGVCEDSCPLGLQVADVVRCSDYYLENTEYVSTAFETYRGLSRLPSLVVCGSCNQCETACRNGVPVVHHIRRAEGLLA